MSRTAYIIRGVEFDENGDRQDDDTDRIPWPGCYWGPRTQGAGPSTESVTGRGRDGFVEGLTIWGPAVDLRSTDRVELDGHLYDVVGVPGRWVGDLESVGGIEVSVQRAGG